MRNPCSAGNSGRNMRPTGLPFPHGGRASGPGSRTPIVRSNADARRIAWRGPGATSGLANSGACAERVDPAVTGDIEPSVCGEHGHEVTQPRDAVLGAAASEHRLPGVPPETMQAIVALRAGNPYDAVGG